MLMLKCTRECKVKFMLKCTWECKVKLRQDKIKFIAKINVSVYRDRVYNHKLMIILTVQV